MPHHTKLLRFTIFGNGPNGSFATDFAILQTTIGLVDGQAATMVLIPDTLSKYARLLRNIGTTSGLSICE